MSPTRPTHPTLLGLGAALPRYGVAQDISAIMSAPLCCGSEEERRLFTILYRRSRVRARYSVLLKQGNGAAQGAQGNGHHENAHARPAAAAGNGDDDGNDHDHDRSTDETRDVQSATVGHDGTLTQSFFNPRLDDGDRGPGTQERMQLYALAAAPLAAAAAAAALADAGISPASIDHLITVSCTGFAAPGVDIGLIRALGLPSDVARTHVGFMGCHGAFNALRIGSALVRADDDGPRHALICAVELCSLHFAYGWDPQRIVANSLFADGAAAAVLASHPPPRGGWRLLASGSSLLPDSEDAMSWRITNHGFEMSLSPRVPDLIQQHLRPWLSAWLAKRGHTIEGIAAWAVHPGGPRILQSVEAALSLPAEALAASHAVLAEYGNMSSPTILFILDRLRRAGVAGPLVALGFGPGLAVEAMLFYK